MGTGVGKRTIVGIAVAAGWVGAVLLLPSYVIFGIFLSAAVICQLEFAAMTAKRGMNCGKWSTIFAGCMWLGFCYMFPTDVCNAVPKLHVLEMVLFTAMGFYLFCRLLFDPKVQKPIESAAFAVLGFFYLPFMLSFLLRLAQWGARSRFEITSEGIFLALFLVAVVKCSDIGGFAVGIPFGRHKMFPRISPGKSWEGLAGGLAASALMGAGLVKLAQTYPCLKGSAVAGFSIPEAAVLGLVLGGVGVIGDLIESMFKRAAEIKDSGGVLPGLGGILDTFDSLIFPPAVLYFYLLWTA